MFRITFLGIFLFDGYREDEFVKGIRVVRVRRKIRGKLCFGI